MSSQRLRHPQRPSQGTSPLGKLCMQRPFSSVAEFGGGTGPLAVVSHSASISVSPYLCTLVSSAVDGMLMVLLTD